MKEGEDKGKIRLQVHAHHVMSIHKYVLADDEGKGKLPKGQLGQGIKELVHSH